MEPVLRRAAVGAAVTATALALSVTPAISLFLGAIAFLAGAALEYFYARAANVTFEHDKSVANTGAAAELATLRAVVDGLAEGLWITRPDGTVVEHNDALKEMLYTGIELPGHRPVELVRSAELQEAVTRACNEGLSSRLEVIVEGIRPRMLQVHVTPLKHGIGGSAAVFSAAIVIAS